MRLAEVLANGETVPAGKLLDPEVGFPEITVDLLEARFGPTSELPTIHPWSSAPVDLGLEIFESMMRPGLVVTRSSRSSRVSSRG